MILPTMAVTLESSAVTFADAVVSTFETGLRQAVDFADQDVGQNQAK